MKQLYRATFSFEGKRYSRTSAVSQQEADLKARQYKQDLENGVIGITKQMTFKAWAYEWLDVYKKPKCIEKVYKHYKSYIDNLLVPQIGTLKLKDVKAIHLQKILNNRAGYSKSDVKRLRDTIRAIFQKAMKSRLITYDPSESLDMPASTDGTHRSMTDFEREHLLKVAETHHAGLMFKTMLYCGLRNGEICALSWKDIDFENQLIHVVAAMESGKNVMKAPKTAAGVRKVPIPDILFVELQKYRGEPFSPVFTQPTTGSRHTETSRKCAWQSFKKAIDDSMGAKWEKVRAKDDRMRLKKTLSVIAPDLTPYCLRHTYCTDLQAKGVQLKTASYLMGHTDIAITANIYTHMTDSALDDVSALLGATMCRTKGNQRLEIA